MSESGLIQERLQALSKSTFRSSFHLGKKEQDIVMEKGLETVEMHALDIVSKRLAPAFPVHDGKQTPFRGHPVFTAQHATATCCRTCLFKWHNIAKARELNDDNKKYVVEVIMAWIKNEKGLI